MNWEGNWLRDLDSNQDSQIQSLESYRLDDPGAVDNFTSVLESFPRTKSTHRARFRKKVAHFGGRSSLERNDLTNRLHDDMRPQSDSAKLVRLCCTAERCPSGLRSTLGKRV